MTSDKKLFLLDGMALVYRAHFAFMTNPIRTSSGKNTSAAFGYVNTLLDLLENQKPSHIALVLDAHGPTIREEYFPEYKAHRDETPEDIITAMPYVRSITEAMGIPVLEYPGYEADDVIGTLATMAEKESYTTFMVTPDKDFGQLVDSKTFIYRPGKKGSEVEILGIPEVCARWNIQRPEQVIDILGLMGDATDNIPGVLGIGEKTAMKLIGEFGDIESLLARTAEVKGKLREKIEAGAENARISRRLATIIRDVPIKEDPAALMPGPRNEARLAELFTELEFNTLGKRILGKDFSAGHSALRTAPKESGETGKPKATKETRETQGDLFSNFTSSSMAVPQAVPDLPATPAAAPSNVNTAATVRHTYHLADTKGKRTTLLQELTAAKAFCFDLETTALDVRTCIPVGIAFSTKAHDGWYVSLPPEKSASLAILEEFKPVLEDTTKRKVGHNLKFDLGVLKAHGVRCAGPFFDTMVAHFLIDPDARHGMDFLSEIYLGYKPISITELIGEKKSSQITMADVPVEQVAEYAAEDADVTIQLMQKFEPLLHEHRQQELFSDLEMPLMEVLVDMQYEGIRIDPAVLAEVSVKLGAMITALENEIHDLAGCDFNINSPRQLGEVLFDKLKISEKAKKTKTGQYATNEQVLETLQGTHPIIEKILSYREATKLKGTYVDTLPGYIHPATGRIHTTFQQTVAATGRLASSDPNIQNIPIRTEIGQEIRRAFVPRSDEFLILSADYSQIELRIMAEMSKDPGLLEAFAKGLDIHTATAARVYGVALENVEPAMRSKAKMVNFGIIYGISAFGLAQRLRIPRQEAAGLIDSYFQQYPGVKSFMETTAKMCREKGYVETLAGRRRYVRDINSANGAIRSAAERVAINAPIQGTAADMIKLAMIKIRDILLRGSYKTRMLLQIHDELVFDLHKSEAKELPPQIEYAMKTALKLEVPVLVELGTGTNWLEAH